MKNKLYILIALIFFGCVDKENTDTYYDDGQIKSKYFPVDSVKNGFIKLEYYSNGVLMDSSLMIDGKKNQLCKKHEQKMGITRYSFFVNDILSGIDSAIYDNGSIFTKGYRNKNQKIGEWLYNKRNGTKERYEFFTLDEKRAYLRLYSNDSLYSIKGEPIIDIQSDSLSSNGEIDINVVLATPPQSEKYFIICENDNGTGRCGEKGCCVAYHVDDKEGIGSCSFHYIFKQKGKVTLVMKYLLINEITQKEEVNRIEKVFYVK